MSIVKLNHTVCTSDESGCPSEDSGDSACEDGIQEACPGSNLEGSRASEKIAALQAEKQYDYGYKPYHN